MAMCSNWIKFLVAQQGYQLQKSGSPSSFLVVSGYQATTKSQTGLAYRVLPFVYTFGAFEY